jgi:hypothetical protein
MRRIAWRGRAIGSPTPFRSGIAASRRPTFAPGPWRAAPEFVAGRSVWPISWSPRPLDFIPSATRRRAVVIVVVKLRALVARRGGRLLCSNGFYSRDGYGQCHDSA